ncbi:MAG: hypothetical protein U5L96_15125 [Owenweeksia sp.]|nr:hypothetical protein [Owenweeksia sp.]
MTRSFIALSLIMGLAACEKDDEDDMDDNPMLKSKTFSYDFNNGQVVPSAAYDANHPGDLTAELMVEEMADGGSKITVTLMNTVDGETYPVHAHDAKDPVPLLTTRPMMNRLMPISWCSRLKVTEVR